MKKQDRLKKLLDKVQTMDLGRGGFWNPPQGVTTIRILPPVDTMDFFFQEVGNHYKQKVYCPRITTDGEQECPICELNEALFQAGERDAASDFWATTRFWMNVVVRGQEAAGVQIYTPGKGVFSSLVSFINDPDYGDIADEDNGFDIRIEREGEGTRTEYPSVRAVRNPSPLGTDSQIDEWLESAKDLTEMSVGMLKSYDEIVEAAGIAAYFGEDGVEELEPEVEENEEDEEETASAKISSRLEKRRKRSRRRR